MQAPAQRLAHLLVAGLAEQGEHILLVGLHARLVEGIHAEKVAAPTITAALLHRNSLKC